MLHDFYLAGNRIRLWQRTGESYEHVLMKALGYAMFAGEYPNLEIEVKVGLRYKPDLIAVKSGGDFEFWGERRRKPLSLCLLGVAIREACRVGAHSSSLAGIIA